MLRVASQVLIQLPGGVGFPDQSLDFPHELAPRHALGAEREEVLGFELAVDGRRAVVVATLDNLLKGAATQALQNLNLALGLDETTGIPT